MDDVNKLLSSGKEQVRAMFAFDLGENTDKEIIFKFNIWVRHQFPKQFPDKDAPFHSIIDNENLLAYRGESDSFTDIVFRDGAKTTRTKMFFAFCVLCDQNHYRKFIKVLTKDAANSKQFVTDVYNILVNRKTKLLYPNTFIKTDAKREESMGAFTTTSGIKVLADTVGTDQRGAVQGDEESARPDLILFDDFETRKTLRSAVETNSIWNNMEEARTGLSKNGSCIYNCNYISERGNVHKLVTRARTNHTHHLLIQPIIQDGKPAWDRFTMSDIEVMRNTDDDFAGERMCEPSASRDVLFDRTTLDNLTVREPIKVLAGFKMFWEYNAGHRYGVGADVAGGVRLDSSADVSIDFSTIPARVVATYASNTIKPDVYGDELERHARMFGEPIVAVENNKFDMCIGRLKQIYNKLYYTQPKDSANVGEKTDRTAATYGWNTNRLTKPKMLFDLKKAVEDGLLELIDSALIAELKSYTRDDLMDNEVDVRLTTRHFDLLIACAIAWQMKDWATVVEKQEQQVTETANPFDQFPS